MTQIETNASLMVGLAVLYLSRGGTTYKAQVIRIYEHERCDLRVFNVPGTTTVYSVPYDSDGQERHSWRKESDVPIASEVHKHRCPTSENTTFYFTAQGLSYRCRHCKSLHVIAWPDIFREHTELCGTTP